MLGFTGDTKLLYTTGEITPGLATCGRGTGSSTALAHLVLPSLVLTVVGIAFYSRYQRNAMLDVLGSDFLRTAQAKGLRRSQALVKHGLRTALIPMATFFAYQFALLFVGATFTEKIFGWHGMGEYFVDSVIKNDVNSVAGVTLFVGVLVLIAGFLSDVAYAALDPRVRVDRDRRQPETTRSRRDSQTTPRSSSSQSSAGAASRGRLVLRRFLASGWRSPAWSTVLLLFAAAYCTPSRSSAGSTTSSTTRRSCRRRRPTHWFGTTQNGFDMFALTMRGMQKSLIIGLLGAAALDGPRGRRRRVRRLLRRRR